MDVELTSRAGAERCVVCHDEGPSVVEACDACRATYHPECRVTVDGCATLGCQRRTAPAVPSPSGPARRPRRLVALGAFVNAAGAVGLVLSARTLLERLPPGADVTPAVWATLASAAGLGLVASGLAGAVVRRRWLVAAAALAVWGLLAGLGLPSLWPHAVPVTSVEVEEVARDLEGGFTERDVKRLSRRLDPFSMMRRHFPGLPADPEGREADPDLRERAVEELVRVYVDSGGLRVLRVEVDEDPPTVVTRVADVGGRLDYLTFTIGRAKDGAACVTDIRYLRLATSWSQELRRTLREPAATRRRYQEVLQLEQQGTAEQVMAALDRLGPAARRDRTLLRAEVDAAEQLDDVDRHEAALVRLQRAVGGRSDLLQLELAFVREDADAGLRAVEAIDRAVGSDPFLDTVRAELHALRGDAARALELARTGATAVPEVERAWWILLACALEAGDHAWTGVALERLVATFHIDPAWIEEAYDLTALAGTPEGAAWAALKAKGR